MENAKECQTSDIPSKINKWYSNIFTNYILPVFNSSVTKSEFPEIPKIIPAFKKTRKKEDYILVRTLQNTLNIADKSLFHRVSNSMESYLSKQQYSFRKGYSTQNCLQVMLEKWRAIFEKRKCFGDVQRRFNALLMTHVFTWLIFMISDTDYASLTVGNTPYVIWKDITEITLSLEDNSLKFF